MSAAGPKRRDIQAALVTMALEAAEAKQLLGGSVTDAVAGWVATRYAQAAREQLADLKGEARLKLMRTLAQDWALLRKGDQTAERLEIERERLVVEQERLALAERFSFLKFKRMTVVGLETLMTYVEHHPKAKAAFDALLEQVRHPWDPGENIREWKDRSNDPLQPNPTESDP